VHHSSLHEKGLVTLLKEGDEAAFEFLYHLYSKRLLGFIIKSVKSETIASELLQDTFIKIWQGREDIDPEQSFRSYLFRISENVVFDFFRKVARDKALRVILINSACEEYSHVEENLYIKENAQIVNDLINRLPPKRREIFQLIKMEDRSYNEVSHALSISPSTISDHIVKATKFIRQHLDDAKVVEMEIMILFVLSWFYL
jgi:RNA polymerase sigma-70 factor (family 1)